MLVYSIKNGTLPEEPAKFVQQAAAQAFHELQPQEVTAVSTHPVGSTHAQKYYQDHCILLGDAAMALHPLAGLGLNCGLQAAQILSNKIIAAFSAEKLEQVDNIGRAYENAVLGYNTFTQTTLNTIHRQLVVGGADIGGWLSCLAFGAAQNSTWIKKQMIHHALYGIEKA